MADVDSTCQWHTIPGYPRYEITRDGTIRLHETRRIRIPSTSVNGYLKVWLDAKHENAFVHRLVALTFLGPCPSGYQVNHKDGNRKNPHIDNLEYVTPSQNARHAVARIGEWGAVAMTANAHRMATHCPHGHPYDVLNTMRTRRGGRRCLACHNATANRARDAKRRITTQLSQ